MSLVGSLEDLGLGDILQIISLSRKSGLLMIHSEQGEGRIVFCDGSVRAAFVKGEASDLRDLLLTTGFVSEEEFARAGELAAARDEPLDAIIPECSELTRESLDSLRREHVERAVFQIFSWKGGEFSFEVRDDVELRDSEILLSTGINAQYLTMEATRMDDEVDRSQNAETLPTDESAAGGFEGELEGESIDEVPDEEPFFSGEAGEGEEEPVDDTDAAALEVIAIAAACREEVDAPVSNDAQAPEPEMPEASRPRPVCLVAIDPELAAVEWQKANLADLFQRVHIFQSSEAGVARIRQYLGRGDLPVALVSSKLAQDAALGSGEIGEFVRRLKQQAPAMPVLVSWVEGEEEVSVPLADGMIRRPNPAIIGARYSAKKLEAAVVNLRADVRDWLDGTSRPDPQRVVSSQLEPATSPIEAGDAASGLQRLRETSQRMRDPDTRGEVLSLVLEFAAESFSRVAIFMVRDETAVGIAQCGLRAAGGPDDDDFCGLEIPVAEVEWFVRVIEGRSAIAQAPMGDGDLALSARLGDQPPQEAYIAPIESGGRVVALLYADNLPAGGSVPDTTILQIVLHEAGIALERALLERALARTESDTPS
jgi:hypothetical protein